MRKNREDETETNNEAEKENVSEVTENVQERMTSSGMELRPRTRINYKAFHT